jgi:predicted nucleic acid-binding protein
MVLYYIDTCVWLNLFFMEKDIWKDTVEFIDKVGLTDIIVSGFVVKELKHKLAPAQWMNAESRLRCFRFIRAIDEDYLMGRSIEQKEQYSLSFYDCMHIALCIRCEAVLVTRDEELLRRGAKYIITKSPTSRVC